MEINHHYEVQFRSLRDGKWLELTLRRPESLEEAKEFYQQQRSLQDKTMEIRIAKVMVIVEALE